MREFYSRYCLSLTPSVCVITASTAAVSSHTHSRARAHTHTHTHTRKQEYTPLPVLPKGTWCWGVPLPKSDRCSNRKSKNQRPIIPIICSDTELMSGFLLLIFRFHLECSNKYNLDRQIDTLLIFKRNVGLDSAGSKNKKNKFVFILCTNCQGIYLLLFLTW